MNRAFTVNVPKNFPAVDSDTAERMAEVALQQRILLAPDAVGSGEKVLRLTVNDDDSSTGWVCGPASSTPGENATGASMSTTVGFPVISASHRCRSNPSPPSTPTIHS